MTQHSPPPSLVRSFVLPALTLFLIPIGALLVCGHFQPEFEQQLTARFQRAINTAPGLNLQQKNSALKALEKTSTWSILNKENKALSRWDSELRPLDIPTYLTYKGVVLLSWGCIGLGIATLLLISIGSGLSIRSNEMLYYSLLGGWYLISIVGLLELIAQTTIIVGLISAYLFSHSSLGATKFLIFIGGAGLAGVGAAAAAMFKRVDLRHEASGVLIEREHAPLFWDDLDRLCFKAGTSPPDYVIAGIEDGFWVTECPVVLPIDDVMRRTLRGRILYVSLPLLKQLPDQEADAILLHEMAHFSGNDTIYSQRIAPLFERHYAYAESLYEHWLTRPIHHLAMLQLVINHSLNGKVARDREHRADQIAARHTSPEAFAFALLRVVAFSRYREQCEEEIYEAAAIDANSTISKRLDDGFRPFAESYFDENPIGELTSVHPFDSHPPVQQRLKFIGFQADAHTLRTALADQSVGPWYRNIYDAEEIERQQWSAYEAEFRTFHETMLVHRYLPSNDTERTLVEKYFPPIDLPVAHGRRLFLDFEKMSFENWEHPIYYHEVETFEIFREEQTYIIVSYRRMEIPLKAKLPLSRNDVDQEMAVRDNMERYSNRSDFAHAYQAEREAAFASQSNNRLTDPSLATS
ncbi:M48 family metallopeptidase [Bremerella sp. JC817]|uniref:M48 family metallopeptidase n=1 Tax=Bremerella sp. JC817 TaxID=3231756 RepID=UPI00345788F4